MPTTYRWAMANGYLGSEQPFISCAELLAQLGKLNRGRITNWRAHVRMADGTLVIVRPKG